MKIIVRKINEVNYRIEEVSPEQRLELKEYLSAYAKGYEHSPKFKQRVWNGKIYYYDAIKNVFACGLKQIFIQFCEKFNYKYEFLDDRDYSKYFDSEVFQSQLKTIYEGSKYYPRDYQETAVSEAIKMRRGILQMATGCLDKDSLINCQISEEAYQHLLIIRSAKK